MNKLICHENLLQVTSYSGQGEATMIMLSIENSDTIEEISRVFNAQTFWDAEHFIDNGYKNGIK